MRLKEGKGMQCFEHVLLFITCSNNFVSNGENMISNVVKQILKAVSFTYTSN